MKADWHIIRVLAGSPLKIAQAIDDLGGHAYAPTEIARRRNRRSGPDRGKVIETVKSLTPGYIFARADKPVDLDRIPAAILARRRKQHDPLRRQRPRTAATRCRLMVLGDHPATLSDTAITALKESIIDLSRAGAKGYLDALVEMLAAIDKVQRVAKRKRGRPVFDTFRNLQEAVR